MGNSGKNSNSSQFFFTLDQAPQCDGKHVIFGEIVSGHEILKKAETFGTIEGIPTAPICITDCGIFTPLLTPGAGYWYDKPDAESWNGISPTFMVRPRVAIAAPLAAKEKFEEALRDVCSITLSLGIDPGSGHSVDGKPAWELLLESISTFSVDLVIIAPVCKELKSKIGEQLPESWSGSGIAFDEVVLIVKPLGVVSSIHTKSWLSKHRDWQLDGNF